VREVSSVVEGVAYLVREEPALLVPQFGGFFPFLALFDDVVGAENLGSVMRPADIR
jgi:hypothetical protein